MARGLCVDCNYDGPLGPMGDCPRCGSEWTTSSEKPVREDDGLNSLLGRTTEFGGTPQYQFDGLEFDSYEL